MKNFFNIGIVLMEATASNLQTPICNNQVSAPLPSQRNNKRVKKANLDTVIAFLHKRKAVMPKKDISQHIPLILNDYKQQCANEIRRETASSVTTATPKKEISHNLPLILNGYKQQYANEIHREMDTSVSTATPHENELLVTCTPACAKNIKHKILALNIIPSREKNNELVHTVNNTQQKLIGMPRIKHDPSPNLGSSLKGTQFHNVCDKLTENFNCTLLQEPQLININNQNPTQKLLLDVLKNVFYYRYNLAKIFQKLTCLFYKGKIETGQQLPMQKRLLAEFITTTLEFVKTPGELPYTDHALFTSENKAVLEDERKQLIDLIVYPATYKAYDITEYEAIKLSNRYFTKKVKQLIKSTHYITLCGFTDVILGQSFLGYQYYDMFVCCMTPLYEISLFFDKNCKGHFEKHLNRPPLPDASFYTNYSLMLENAVFYWAMEWLYFFSNYWNIATFFAEKMIIVSLLEKLPKEFFINLFLLLHFATKYEQGGRKQYEDNDENVDLLKRDMQSVFYSMQRYNCVYLEKIIIFFRLIQDIYGKKIYTAGGHNSIWLIRTTLENIYYTNKLEPTLWPIINEIFTLIKQVN